MNLALGTVGLVAAIVILATKIIELKLAVVKYRKENPQPIVSQECKVSVATTPVRTKRSLWDLWEPLVDLFALVISYLIVLGLSLSKGLATKQDLGALGLAIVFWFAANTTTSA